jgi:hypothetical protein
MEQWWNDTDRGKPKYFDERNLSQWHFVHHKSNADWPGIELGLPPREAGDQNQSGCCNTVTKNRGLTKISHTSVYSCFIFVRSWVAYWAERPTVLRVSRIVIQFLEQNGGKKRLKAVHIFCPVFLKEYPNPVTRGCRGNAFGKAERH